MNPELERELRQAQAAIANGANRAQVMAMFQKRTGTSIAEAERAVLSQATAPTPQAKAKPARGLLGKAADLGRMAFHGLSASFSDELSGVGAAIVPGGKTYVEARDASRENLERIRQEQPLAALGAEIGGSVALPVGAIGAAARGASLGVRAVRGAVAGAAAGGLFGAGSAEDLSDVPGDAAIGAGLGAATGAAAPALGAAVNRLRAAFRPKVTGEAAGAAVRSATGVQRSYDEALSAADEMKAAASRMYQALEKDLPAIDDPRLKRVLSKTMKRHADKLGIDDTPSFEQVQALRNRVLGMTESARRKGRNDLVTQYKNELKILDDVLDEVVPGFRDARSAYATAVRVTDGLADGRTLFGKSSADIGRALEEAGPEAAEALRGGMAFELERKVTTTGSAKFLRSLADPGPEQRRKYALMFGEAGADEIFALAARNDLSGIMKLIKEYRTWVVGAGLLEGGRRIKNAVGSD
jgi:hypothetical protein